MANTFVDYTVGAGQTDFAFSFPYLDDSHVVVQLDDSTGSSPGGKFYTVSTGDYTIITSPSTLIRFTTAPETGARLRIKRDSIASTALVDFENGSVLTETELDRAYLHNLYLNEEVEEGGGKNTMTKNTDGNYDADLAKIINVADPTSAQDAASKNYVDTQDALQVTKTGDSMSGALAMGSNKITSLADPTASNDAANKSYVDSNIAASLATGVPGGQIDTANIADDAITADKLADTAVTPGSYTTTNLTVDQQGRITAASNGATIPTNNNQLTNGAGYITDSDVASNAAVAANTAKVTNATHTGDVTGATALTIANNAVTAAKISSTDTTFNVDTNVGIGAVASGISKLDVTGTGNNANFQADNAGGTSAIFVRNTSATGESAIVQLIGQAIGGTSYSNSLNIDLSSINNFLQMVFNQGDQIGVRLDNSNNGAGSETGAWYPSFDNKTSLGKSGNRWSVVYSGTGAINTSDRNQKEEIEELSEAELRVAQACKGLVRKFKFKGRVRKHIGVIAQDVEAAFAAEGLNASDYGLFCSDTFEDEEGNTVTQLGIRYEELLAFIISAL